MCSTYEPGIVDGALLQTLDRRSVIEDAAIGVAEPMAVSRAEATIIDRAMSRMFAKRWVAEKKGL